MDEDEHEFELWCDSQRRGVVAYLDRQRLAHGEVGEWPAWDVYPHAALWAVESLKRPGFVGWWAISGDDVPNDYVTCGPQRHPREALREIGNRWLAAATALLDGRQPEGFTLALPGALPQADLAPLLSLRGGMLLSFADDDDMWREEP